MCEYCGCQDVAAIAVLTHEHEVVVNLGGEVRRALAAGALDLAADRARAVSAVLGPHTAVEEGALFPAMTTEFPGHVRGLIDEHRLLEEVLAESAAGTPDDPEWPGRLNHALTRLREHIRKEEDGLFPAALASLGPAEWERLDTVRSQVGSAVAATSG